MKDFVFISEQLENLHVKEKIDNLSNKYKGKKVVLFGTNSVLDAVCEKYNLKEKFNIVGICDENVLNSNIFVQNDFKMLSIQNLYFSGVDVVINLKFDNNIKKIFRKNHYVKKRVKIENLFEKSLIIKLTDIYNILKKMFETYKKKKNLKSVIQLLFCYDNEYLISKFNYEEKVFELQKRTKKTLRVLFLIFDYKFWTLNSLYDLMRSDDNFKVLPLAVMPNSFKEGINADEDTIKYLKENGYDYVEGVDPETQETPILKALKPDIIIYQQNNFLKNDYTPQNFSEYSLTCCVESDLQLEKVNDDNFSKNRLNNTWKIYSANEYLLKEYTNSVGIGVTFFEKYNAINSEKYKSYWSNATDVKNNKIVYIPTYSINEKKSALQFKEQQLQILEFAAKHPDYSFIVIPHYELRQKCIENKILTDEEYDNYFSNWLVLPNAVLSDYSNINGIFKTSNMLISDGIDVVSGYFLTNKPILFLNKIEFKLNDFGKNVFKTLYKIKSIEQLEEKINDILALKNDYTLNIRNKISEKYNNILLKNSSNIILEDLKKTLNKK